MRPARQAQLDNLERPDKQAQLVLAGRPLAVLLDTTEEPQDKQAQLGRPERQVQPDNLERPGKQGQQEVQRGMREQLEVRRPELHRSRRS